MGQYSEATEVSGFKDAIVYQFGMQCKMDSELTGMFDYWIQRLEELGILSALRDPKIFDKGKQVAKPKKKGFANDYIYYFVLYLFRLKKKFYPLRP